MKVALLLVQEIEDKEDLVWLKECKENGNMQALYEYFSDFDDFDVMYLPEKKEKE